MFTRKVAFDLLFKIALEIRFHLVQKKIKKQLCLASLAHCVDGPRLQYATSFGRANIMKSGP